MNEKGFAVEISGSLVWALIVLALLIAFLVLLVFGKINPGIAFLSSFLKIFGG